LIVLEVWKNIAAHKNAVAAIDPKSIRNSSRRSWPCSANDLPGSIIRPPKVKLFPRLHANSIENLQLSKSFPWPVSPATIPPPSIRKSCRP
jgi:hypothetical protein